MQIANEAFSSTARYNAAKAVPKLRYAHLV